MNSKVYIKAATQISIQQPLSEQWMTEPLAYAESYVRSQDPNFRDWLNPLESRRMGKILKRALVTALKVMQDSGIHQPDAIITGTGLGCIENTELFLGQLCREGEEMLKPTAFMQSTHNTISSLIAIHCRCHGYNTTYSHKHLSFDTALLDAFTQMQLGDISTALVTGNDELTPSWFSILRRTGSVGQPGQLPASEASVAMMLTTDPADALCEVEQVRLHYGTAAAFSDSDIPSFDYKQLFGECYAASGLGVYAAAHLLHAGQASRLQIVSENEEGSSCILLKSVL